MRQSLALVTGPAWAYVAALAPLLLGGCNRVQNTFGGDGSGSASFTWLFMVFLAVTGLSYALTIGFLLAALLRRHSSRDSRLLRPAFIGWAAFIVGGLTVLVVASFLTDRSDAEAQRDPRLEITVIGRQYWWDVDYGGSFRTANEIHLPVGVPVRLRLQSADVIHSLWIPNLAGKQDLIPGRVNHLGFVPLRTGLFRGECAEFCGIRHANMTLIVRVESVDDFRRWRAAQLRRTAG